MLHTETVDASTLELLRALQNKAYLKGFYLVGGTALALYWGHRQSIDIDLFTNDIFDTSNLLEQIQQDFSYQLSFTAPNTLKGSINDIKVDIIAHRYPYLQQPDHIDEILLLSEEDIIAMKLNAISVSGQRSKDFIDIFYALKKYPISEMLGFYKTKYDQQQTEHVLKSLIYFDDVDLSDWPVLTKSLELKWADVKKGIEKEVKRYVKKYI